MRRPNKRIFCAIALVLALLAGLCPAALAQPLDDLAALSLLLPGAAFTPGEDFFYKPDPAPVRYGNPEPDLSLRLREQRPFGGDVLLVFEGYATVHASNWHHLIFAVYSPAQGGLAGEALWLSADAMDYYIGYRGGELSVLYVSSTIGQGLESCGGARMAWTGASWRMAWPTKEGMSSGAYYEYWDYRKAQLSYDRPGSLTLYTRAPHPPADGREPDLADYCWQLEGHAEPFYDFD